MIRRRAATVALASAIVLATTTGLLSTRLADARRGAAARYSGALDRQAASASPLPPSPPPVKKALNVCPSGANTFARSIAIRFSLRLVERGHLDPSALATLSNLASLAERRAERTRGSSSLPQRMGKDVRPVAPTCVAVPRP